MTNTCYPCTFCCAAEAGICDKSDNRCSVYMKWWKEFGIKFKMKWGL